MKAVVCTQYGPPSVLQIRNLKKPQPKDHEILIKVLATTAHIGDTRIRRADPFLVRLVFGLFKPRKNLVLGFEISGEIESVGTKVSLFKPGDEVFALTGFGLGGYAEYVCLSERAKEGRIESKGLVAHKPVNLSFEEAASVPAGGLTALKNLHKSNIQQGDHILINGASGSLGTYAIQLSKYFGAQVTAVCSAKNFELVKSLGADRTVDYTQEDFTQLNEKYNIVYDAVMKSKASRCKKILKKNGVFLNNNRLPKIRSKDILFLKQLIEEDHLKPVIDQVYTMDEVVEAHRYVDRGHKRGHVPIKIR